MRSISVAPPAEVGAAFDGLAAALATIGALNLDAYAPRVRLQALELMENARRQQTVASHDLIASLANEDAAGLGGPVHRVIDERNSVADEPDQELAAEDARSHAQRQHDALNALVRGQLGNPKLGVHNGLPVTVVVTTTLQELGAAAGQAVTGGGTLLPMRDLIRLAGRAHHYLAVFDGHQNRPLYLARARRIASADQRLVLYAKDRGCTAPGCDVPAHWTEVHHDDDWAHGGRTDIDRLTLACKPHHKMVDKGWRTIKLGNGNTQWIPPPHLDHGQPWVNDYYHPETFLGGGPPRGQVFRLSHSSLCVHPTESPNAHEPSNSGDTHQRTY